MKKLTVHIHEKPACYYDILIGTGLLSKISELVDITAYTKAAIITDKNIASHYLQPLQQAISIPNITIVLEPGETHKTIESVQEIWKQLQEAKFDRKSLVINLGGGVIGDMGGFAASTYMRGIDFINIPTTILAQVDESVGGKTGIDFAGVKNLIGTFEQPKSVLIDLDTVATLPEREFVSGFAEIIKHGVILDKEYFEKVTAKPPLAFSPEELIDIIAGSCEIKKKVVEEDTTEKGSRKLVNFGHTIGHAIEALMLETEKPLLHGEAISIGMVAEAKLSELKLYISSEDVTVVLSTLEKAGLPVNIKEIPAEKILEKIANDKKTVGGTVKWTLLKQIGEASYDEEVDDDVVKKAIEFISK